MRSPHTTVRAACLLALLSFMPNSAPANGPAGDFVVPDMSGFLGTWLWRSSEGLVAESTPQTKGASRTLVLNPDLSYEYRQRRGTRDTVLCKGQFSFSEQTVAGGETATFIAFQNWFEPYEANMYVDFEGPDTLQMIGARCESCPDHTFVRGRAALFSADVKRGEPFRRDLWGGLRFELRPLDAGWEVVVRDTTRPGENLARQKPSLIVPDPKEPRGKRDFVFSGEGRGVLTVEDMTPGTGKGKIESMRFVVAIEEARGRAQEGRP